MTRLPPFVHAGAVTLLVATAGCSSQPRTTGSATSDAKAPAKPAPHAFRGTVEKVDTTARSVMVAGEDVEGWMGAMIMVYEIEPPEMLAKLAAGDHITATVYDGDFKTLHDVKLAPPAPPK